MPIAFWCVLLAGLMPYIAVSYAKFSKASSGRFNNHNPRDWLAKQEGAAKRAHAAHLNCFEAFPFFAAGVLMAAHMKAPPGMIDGLAVFFVLVRGAYIVAYITDKASLRSLLWFAGFAATIGCYFIAAYAKS